jgi:hypothetical protein
MGAPWGGRGFGRGRGGNWGGGWGRRNRYYATGLTGWQRAAGRWFGPDAWSAPAVSRDQDLVGMRQEALDLEQSLGELRARIQELERAATTPAPEGETR